MTESTGKSCWTCVFHNIASAAFLGTCTWFEKNEKGENKDIPPDVVDKGCKHWKEKKNSATA